MGIPSRAGEVVGDRYSGEIAGLILSPCVHAVSRTVPALAALEVEDESERNNASGNPQRETHIPAED